MYWWPFKSVETLKRNLPSLVIVRYGENDFKIKLAVDAFGGNVHLEGGAMCPESDISDIVAYSPIDFLSARRAFEKYKVHHGNVSA